MVAFAGDTAPSSARKLLQFCPGLRLPSSHYSLYSFCLCLRNPCLVIDGFPPSSFRHAGCTYKNTALLYSVFKKINMSKPVSRVLCSFNGVAAIYLGCQLPGPSSDSYPRDSAGNVISLLFSLAPGGVYLAGQSPGLWYALTVPLHPYRKKTSPGGLFLWHFPWGCPHWVLPSTLPYGARTFLESINYSRGCPVYSC